MAQNSQMCSIPSPCSYRMTSSSSLCSPLNFPSSRAIPSTKISLLNSPFLKFKTFPRNFVSLNASSDSTVALEAETCSKSDGGIILDEEDEKALGKVGSRVRVKVPLKVYHVPKVPEIELTGRIGLLKQYVAIHKGKRISANLPYKVEFVAEDVQGRSGPVKFSAHLKDDEFEYLD